MAEHFLKDQGFVICSLAGHRMMIWQHRNCQIHV